MVYILKAIRILSGLSHFFKFSSYQVFKRDFPVLIHTSGGSSKTNNTADSNKAKIFVTHPGYPKNGIDILQKSYEVEVYSKGKELISKEELVQGIKGKHGLFCNSKDRIDKEVLHAAGPQLKVVSTMSVGVEHIDVEECKRLSVRVGYTPDVLTEATAELTVALLLATSRRLFEASKQLRTGGWVPWAPLWMCGQELKDSTIGLVGFGRIGREVAYKLKTFYVKRILFTDSGAKPSSEKLEAIAELGAERMELEALLLSSDFVIVTCSLTPETQKLFDSQRFDIMKPSAIFINTGRGGVVDQDSLYDALKNRKILAAGLDVMTPEPIPTDHPLTKLPNCVLLPHIGSATYQARTAMSELTANNIVAALENRPMPAEYL